LVFSLIHLTPQPPLHAVERGSFRLVFPLSTQWLRGSVGGVLEKVSSQLPMERGAVG